MKLLLQRIKQELLPVIQIRSVNPHDPVEVGSVPSSWRLLGAGNYAAVVYHIDYPAFVVKLYAANRSGFEEEVEVYRRLGHHPAFSQCLYAKNGFLILRRLHGVTLYDCLNRGLAIPKQVIQDVDRALEYARSRGLHPHDIHGRNVMMHQGRGLVVDVSDFLKEEPCTKWRDLKLAYYWFYRPFLMPLRLRVPYSLLDQVRRGYRFLRRVVAQRKRLS
ncbi:serine/threonine protein kinase [Phormidium tenue FACHB-886]|nr:serine/threonine protein kinase [Phormidium tenue FACHB-886]